MKKALLAGLVGTGFLLIVGLLAFGHPQADAEEPTPWPYVMYFPIVFKNTFTYSTQVLTIPVGWMVPLDGRPNNVIRVVSFGHTHAEAYDPSGGHVCVTCEQTEYLAGSMVYEADYGTWYYVSRAYVSVPIPEGVRVITAALNVNVCASGYQYSGPPPAVRLNVGNWADSAFPNNWRALWGAWDKNRILGEYQPSTVWPNCWNAEQNPVSIPLDVSHVQPGRTLKFVWRLRDDDRDIVNADGQAPRYVRVAVQAWNPCYAYCSQEYYAELAIGYLP